MNKQCYLDLFKEKKYIHLLIANMINRFGDSIDTIAFSWIVYAVTGEGKWAAIVFAVNKIPSVIVLPFAGAFVERIRKKNVIVFCDTIRCLLVAFLLLYSQIGEVNLLVLLLFSFFISMTEAFRFPASTSFITQILPDAKLSRGVTLNVIITSVVEFGGTAIAGLIVSYGGISTALSIDILTFILSNVLIIRIKHAENIEPSIEETNNAKMFLAGIRNVLSNKKLIQIFLLGCLANISMAPIDSLQTAMVVEVFGQDISYLSVLNTMLSIGMLIGGIIYPYCEERVHGTKLLLSAFLIISLIYFSVSIFDTFKVCIPAGLCMIFAVEYFFYGIAAAFISTGCCLSLLRASKKSQIARTNTLFSSVCSTVTPISATLAGIFAGIFPFNTHFAIIGSAILMAIVCFRRKISTTMT